MSSTLIDVKNTSNKILVAVSSGILGFVLANVDLVLAEQIDAETAWRVSTAYATAAVSV